MNNVRLYGIVLVQRLPDLSCLRALDGRDLRAARARASASTKRGRASERGRVIRAGVSRTDVFC